MKRLALVAAAVATLGACTTTPPPRPIAIQPNTTLAYHPGSGVVQRVFPAPVAAAAGATAPAQPLQPLEIKMDNGPVQYVDTESREIEKGMRISLTEDRQIRKQ